MSDVYIQYHIVKPEGAGEAHRTGFMTPEILKEWLADGWSVHKSYPDTKLGKSKKGFLVPLSMAYDSGDMVFD